MEAAQLIALLSVVSLYSAVVYYLTNNELVPFKALHAYALIASLTLLVVAAGGRGAQAVYVHFGVVGAAGLMLGLLALHAIIFPLNEVAEVWFESRIGFSLMFIAFLLLFSACRSLQLTLLGLFAVVVFSSVINLVEFFSGGQVFGWLSTVPGRAAGFYENANDSAMYICFAVPVLAMRSGGVARISLYAISLLGVYVTFSRSGLILWGVAVLAAELSSTFSGASRTRRVSLIVLAVFIVGLVFLQFGGTLASSVVSSLDPLLDTNTLNRIYFLDNVSSNERMHVLERGLEEFGNAPIFGQGTGFTQTWSEGVSVHNVFVLLLAEYGFLGMLWLAYLFVCIWRYRSTLSFALLILLIISGFFTHNHFDRPAVALIIALYLELSHRQSQRTRSTLKTITAHA